MKGASGTRRLVAKAVDPPKGRAGDVGHQRKLDAYAVEVTLYELCVCVGGGLDTLMGRAGDGGHQRKLDSHAVEVTLCVSTGLVVCRRVFEAWSLGRQHPPLVQRACRWPLTRPVCLSIPISNTNAQAAFYRACAPRLAELATSLGLDAAGPSSTGSSGGGGDNDAPAPAAASSGDLRSDLGGPQISWCWAPQPVVVEAAPPRHFLFVLSDLRAAFPQQPHAYDLEVRLCVVCTVCRVLCAKPPLLA